MHSGMNSENKKAFKRARTTALVLLFFLGISALPPAVFMITDPSGNSMLLPGQLLEQTPFKDFLIPGIILGVCNGILSLLLAILVIRKHRLQSWLVIFQGGILTIWLTVEVLMGIFYAFLTLPYYLVAALLLGCGVLMKSQQLASGSQ